MYVKAKKKEKKMCTRNENNKKKYNFELKRPKDVLILFAVYFK